MNKFVRNLLTEWRRLGLPFADETFIVAVSGGADSVSLAIALDELRKLKKLNLRFVVAHFNHDLRGEESERDEQFVKDFAGKFNFGLAFHKEKIASDGNLEQNARLARYKFLLETAENLHAAAVLTAHTLNDQAETFLLNLIRGSGLEGLGGMKTIRSLKPEFQSTKSEVRSPKSEVQSLKRKEILDFNDQSEIENQKSEIKLIRPLLNWAKREATENFCRERQIEFRYDSMNDDLAFRRVRIRKVLLPLLEDFNPKIVETLAKTANLLQADFAGLENSAAKIFEAKESGEQSLELKELKNLFPSMRRQILREWLKNRRSGLRSLDSKHLEAIENLIFSRKSGKIIELPNGEIVMKRQGKLLFEKTKVEKSPPENYNQGLDFKSVENAIENNE